MEKRYTFQYVDHCVMCGDSSSHHKVLGQRLNQSQGLSARKKTGISITVVQCTNCQLIYANPLPIPHTIQDHYGIPAEEYWKPSYFEFHDNYFLQEIEQLKKIQPITPGMKALDIGAGLGKCMIALNRAGFDVYGFEPSASFHKMAVEKMNIEPTRLKLGSIEEVGYESGMFDFVTFGAVLEHLYDPAGSISKALQWLKPGGIMHIEVPSSRYFMSSVINLMYRIMGTNYVTNISPMHEPYHLYEFGLKSFQEHSKNGALYSLCHHEYFVCGLNQFPKIIRPFIANWMKWTDSGMQLTVWLKKAM